MLVGTIFIFFVFYNRYENEFLCENNFCVRRRQNSKYDAKRWIINRNDDTRNNDISCNGVLDCPDGSDETAEYAGCRNLNGKKIFDDINLYSRH